jgi:cytochrome c
MVGRIITHRALIRQPPHREEILTLLLVLVVSTAPLLGYAQTPTRADAGRAIYEKRCRACHGPSGEGNASIARALKIELSDLRSPAVQKKTNTELKRDMLGGYGKKKPLKLSDTEVADVMAFVRSIARK